MVPRRPPWRTSGGGWGARGYSSAGPPAPARPPAGGGRTCFQDGSSEFSGAVEGVNRTADLYAGLFAASGNLAPIDIEVIGIGDLRQYANVQTYLESLTFISHVSVAALTGDTIRFRLATRGGAESLQRTLSLSGRLQPIAAGDNGILRFQLRR